jgi:lysophospholipid acyltransferase (LPLAT)-like uncharacterized protein
VFEKGRVMAGTSSISEGQPAPHKKQKSGIVVPHTPTWYQRLGAWLVFILLRSLAMTIRFKLDNRSEIINHPPTGPVIFCIWHNRLGLSMEAYRVFGKIRPNPGMAAMVSASKDGGFLAAILERFKVQPVRGSSSRRGPQALLELTTWAERGHDLAITPDGPRGPRYVVQEGVMALAQLTGLPIIPVSYDATWKIQVKSWDRFHIPLPFTRCEMNAATPIFIPRDISDAEREALRQQLERTMKQISRE